MNDALIHLSGGQDSTFTLWDYLNRNPNSRVVVHHVNLRHISENRHKKESQSARAIVQHFKKLGYNIIPHESTFDYGTLPKIAVKDIQIIALFTSIIQKTSSLACKELLLSWHKGEVHLNEDEQGQRVKRLLNAYEAKIDKISFPIQHLTRSDMYNLMPKELFEMCWVCRSPINDEPCQKCKTCKEFIDSDLPIPLGL